MRLVEPIWLDIHGCIVPPDSGRAVFPVYELTDEQAQLLGLTDAKHLTGAQETKHETGPKRTKERRRG